MKNTYRVLFIFALGSLLMTTACQKSKLKIKDSAKDQTTTYENHTAPGEKLTKEQQESKPVGTQTSKEQHIKKGLSKKKPRKQRIFQKNKKRHKKSSVCKDDQNKNALVFNPYADLEKKQVHPSPVQNTKRHQQAQSEYERQKARQKRETAQHEQNHLRRKEAERRQTAQHEQNLRMKKQQQAAQNRGVQQRKATTSGRNTVDILITIDPNQSNSPELAAQNIDQIMRLLSKVSQHSNYNLAILAATYNKKYAGHPLALLKSQKHTKTQIAETLEDLYSYDLKEINKTVKRPYLQTKMAYNSIKAALGSHRKNYFQTQGMLKSNSLLNLYVGSSFQNCVSRTIDFPVGYKQRNSKQTIAQKLDKNCPPEGSLLTETAAIVELCASSGVTNYVGFIWGQESWNALLQDINTEIFVAVD